MAREWYYLDALQQQRGPVTDAELSAILTAWDCYVWTSGLPGWVMASELFASEVVPPLREPKRTKLDGHGQPLARGLNAARRADRDLSELLGLIRGITADGAVNDAEAKVLQRWLDANPDVRDEWPASVLADRLARIFADGRIDEEERAELLDLLHQTTGDRPEVPEGQRGATRLPLDDPAPTLIHVDQVYVFTGKFLYGTRSACERAVIERGGRCASSISGKVNVVVIGTLGSQDWIQSSHGRKIEAAVDLRGSGHPITIVAEEHWVGALGASGMQ